jgi:hypothetical protein
MLNLLIQLRMRPLTALMRIISPSLGIGLLGLTTTRPVALVQSPAQTQPWWLFLRG